MEYLFHGISPIIICEAERQVGLLFGGAVQVPADLICVHVRYGDKFWEMDLAAAAEYTEAVSQISLQRGQGHNRTANIYLLATEDPRAVDAFIGRFRNSTTIALHGGTAHRGRQKTQKDAPGWWPWDHCWWPWRLVMTLS
jgi:hypothetical protein